MFHVVLAAAMEGFGMAVGQVSKTEVYIKCDVTVGLPCFISKSDNGWLRQYHIICLSNLTIIVKGVMYKVWHNHLATFHFLSSRESTICWPVWSWQIEVVHFTIDRYFHTILLMRTLFVLQRSEIHEALLYHSLSWEAKIKIEIKKTRKMKQAGE